MRSTEVFIKKQSFCTLKFSPIEQGIFFMVGGRGGAGGGRGRRVLWTSSDRDDRTIFFGFEIFDSGMFFG